jgi:redox-sensing transcriptional repressor
MLNPISQSQGAGKGRDSMGFSDIPDRVVERLSVYRRLLDRCEQDDIERVFSHELARMEGLTPAQVRRDLMTIGFSGSPSKGYEVLGLRSHIDALLGPALVAGIGVVGMGHIGIAVVDYFGRRRGKYDIRATFDVDPELTGREIHGHRCHHVDDLETVVREQRINVAVITVPAKVAQSTAERLVAAGVSGLLNFAPVRLRVPKAVYVEDLDISVSLEKVMFFAAKAKEET